MLRTAGVVNKTIFRFALQIGFAAHFWFINRLHSGGTRGPAGEGTTVARSTNGHRSSESWSMECHPRLGLGPRASRGAWSLAATGPPRSGPPWRRLWLCGCRRSPWQHARASLYRLVLRPTGVASTIGGVSCTTVFCTTTSSTPYRWTPRAST